MSSELPICKVSRNNTGFLEKKENNTGDGCPNGLLTLHRVICLKGFVYPLLFLVGFLLVSLQLFSQGRQPADSLQFLTLDQCIVYALKHQPAYMESAINVSIARKTNAVSSHDRFGPSRWESNCESPMGPTVFGWGLTHCVLRGIGASKNKECCRRGNKMEDGWVNPRDENGEVGSWQ